MLSTAKEADAALALARFGLGGRPGDRARIAADPRGALAAELATPDAARLDDAGLGASDDLLRRYMVFLKERRAARERRADAKAEADAGNAMKPQAGGMAPNNGDAMDGAPRVVPLPRKIYRDEVLARIAKARAVEIGFVERLAAFWSNHFTASADRRPVVRVVAGAFEREAIRPHVVGRFHDMLLAVTRHPAMLAYLDNRRSIGPNSPAGRRSGRGLNENHARELMELHTVGVRGGYSQADVTALARILTGWGIGGPQSDAPGGFAFQERRHEPGAQTVMGKTYAEDGAAQGEAALADLARHPATATHVAEKLARAFVADDPPPALVERLTAIFNATDGDLAAVSRALIEADEAWSAPAVKFRSPQEFLFASVRALDVAPRAPLVIRGLDGLGQGLWSPNSPKGFSERGADWLAPDAITNRLGLAEELAALAGDRDPLALADDVLGARLTDETRTAVRRAGSRAQGLALLLMSPEMQRR